MVVSLDGAGDTVITMIVVILHRRQIQGIGIFIREAAKMKNVLGIGIVVEHADS